MSRDFFDNVQAVDLAFERIFGSPRGTRNPEPLLSSVEASASPSRDIVAQSAPQAEPVCTDCNDTGTRHRVEDGAPMQCWCENGDSVGSSL